MNEGVHEIYLAGGIVTERIVTGDGSLEEHIWLVVNPASAREHAADPSVPIRYQLPMGSVEPYESSRVSAERGVYEDLCCVAVAGEVVGIFEHEDSGLLRKTVTIYAMDKLPGVQLATQNLQARLVRIDHGLLTRMHHEAEAAFLSRHFGLELRPRVLATA